MPVSSFTWSGIPDGNGGFETASSRRASRIARDVLPGMGAEDEDPRLRERRTQREPLAGSRYAERLSPFVERDPPDVSRAVPVRVGLHDRPELRSAEHAA